MNRETQVAYGDETIGFTYDSGTNGKGRLTGASDTNLSMAWTYDTHGRVTGKAQKIGTVTRTVGYSYTNGDMITMVTPAGQTLTYTYTNHQITAIAWNGTTILSGVTHDPFGPVTGWTWGNATSASRTYTEDGYIANITSAADTINFGEDNASRITGITDTGASAYSWTIGYDALDRVTSGAQTAATYGWTYDANGNRLTQTGTSASTFTPSTTSNRLNSTSGSLVRTYSYDAAGNPTGSGTAAPVYNNRGRVVSDTVGSVPNTFTYNPLGQLAEYYYNATGATTITMMYDEVGHLIGQYYPSGTVMRETLLRWTTATFWDMVTLPQSCLATCIS